MSFICKKEWTLCLHTLCLVIRVIGHIMKIVTYAVATENEGCFALADGLGGQGKGDVASKFVVEEVKKKYDQK